MQVLKVSLLAALTPVVLGLPSTATYNPRPRYDMPLTWTPFGFTTPISLGTPRQSITAFIDWTWNSLYQVTTTCLGKDNNMGPCFLPEQEYFNQSRSSTFKDLRSKFPSQLYNPNHFFFNLDLKVDYVEDIEQVGPAAAPVRFQSADFQFKQQFVFPFSSVYGLSPVFKEQKNSAQSTFWQAWKQRVWSSPLIAFHFCYGATSPDPQKKTCGGTDGIQSLGGYDRARVKGDIEWLPIINFTQVNTEDFIYSPGFYDYWTVPLTGFSLGDEPQAINKSTGAGAVFDHASYGKGAPLSHNAYDKLIAKVGAVKIETTTPPNNGEQDTYEFDCAKTASLPPIKYQFGKRRRTWEIVPKNYVTESQGKPGRCIFDVRTIGSGNDFIIGNFGETFGKDKYILMDFEKLLVGIADVKW